MTNIWSLPERTAGAIVAATLSALDSMSVLLSVIWNRRTLGGLNYVTDIIRALFLIKKGL